MWHYVLDDRYLKRNPHIVPPDVRHQVSDHPGPSQVFPTSRTLSRFNELHRANRFTSACSPIVYRDQLIGAASQTYTFVCEPVHNLVHREVMTSEGLSFTSRRPESENTSEFLSSSDSWFRPSMVRTGPDGALWVSDMYRFVIEHPKWIPEATQRKMEIRAGDTMGRIYRIRNSVVAPRVVPQLDKFETEKLVETLESPNGWLRDMAQQLLIWRNDQQAVEPLKEMVKNSEQPLGRLHALCTLDGMNEITSELITMSMKDQHPAIRKHAVRIGEPLMKNSGQLYQYLSRLVLDPDPLVQIQVAYSLGELDHEVAGKYLVQLARRFPEEVHLNAALLSSVHRGNLPSVVAELIEGSDRVPEQFAQQVFKLATVFGDKSLLDRLVIELLRPSQDGFSDWQFSSIQTMLDAIDADGRNPAKFLSSAARNRVSSMIEFASAIAADTNLDESIRISAIRFLGTPATNAQETQLQLTEFLLPHHLGEIQSEAVASLLRSRSPATAKIVLARWSSFTPEIRGQVLDALLSRPAWTGSLLSAIENGEVSVAHLNVRRREQLVVHRDPGLRKRAKRLFSTSTNSSRKSVLDSYQDSMLLVGDRAQGKLHFEKHCSACHQLENVGHDVGPDLSALTDKSKEGLLIALLDPNRAVEGKYLEYVATTSDGRLLSGIITSETGVSLTLTSNDGKKHDILRSELDEIRSSGRSLMPEGIEKDFSHQQLANVIAYIRGFGLPHKKFANNEPAIANADPDGSLQLTATMAKIYGPSLVFEQPFRNLGYWQSSEDHAIWQAIIPHAGTYRISFDYACHANDAGNRFNLVAGGTSINGTIAGTGTWDNYQTRPLGKMELPAGPVEFVLRSEGAISGAMLDLRSIRLKPVPRKEKFDIQKQ